MSHRRLFVLALIAGMPGIAGAQFTTFIPPKPKAVDSVKAVVVAQQQAQADTALSARITNMKTWVDSAAGVAPAPMTSHEQPRPSSRPIIVHGSAVAPCRFGL